MWFEKITKPLTIKKPSLSMRMLFIPAALLCLNPWRVAASSEEDLLDPALILLQNAQTQTAAEEKITSNKNDTIAGPYIELKSSQYPQTLPPFLSPDARFMFFSTTDTSFNDEHIEPAQPAPEQRQLTQKDKLLRTSMSSVPDDANNLTKQTLNNLIEQISLMKIRPKVTVNKSESQPADESKTPTSNDKETDESTQPAAEKNDHQQTSANDLSPEIVKKLEWIIEQSATTDEPELLADILYQSGYYELAAYFYGLAVSRDTEEQTTDFDKSWLMMQKAVCLSNTNPQQALQIYKGLISQYPVSPWTELAKNYEELLDWLEAQQPKKLIEQCKQDLKTN
jgi:tetratricopeptide (TPR) repeat protein